MDAEIVREIFARYLDGEIPRRIAAALNRRKCRHDGAGVPMVTGVGALGRGLAAYHGHPGVPGSSPEAAKLVKGGL